MREINFARNPLARYESYMYVLKSLAVYPMLPLGVYSVHVIFSRSVGNFDYSPSSTSSENPLPRRIGLERMTTSASESVSGIRQTSFIKKCTHKSLLVGTKLFFCPTDGSLIAFN